MWSLGVILYITLSGIPPFNGGSDSEIFKCIDRGKFDFRNKAWNHVGDSARDLITKMLTYD